MIVHFLPTTTDDKNGQPIVYIYSGLYCNSELFCSG